MYLDVSSRSGDVREDSSLFAHCIQILVVRRPWTLPLAFIRMGLVFWSYVNQPDYHLVIWLVVDRLRYKTALLHQDWHRVDVYFVWLLRVNDELGLMRGCALENYGEPSVARIVIAIEPFEGKLRIAISFGLMRLGQVQRLRSWPFPFTIDVLFVCLLLESIMKRGLVHFGSRRF